jgi:uncharacterized membrane protein YeaQ/YmgE (transglycosylase-associated protein family)
LWIAVIIVIGLAAGWCVAFLAENGRRGLAADLVTGIAGSLLGGIIGKYLGLGRHSLLGRGVISAIAACFCLTVLQVAKRS